MDIGVKLNALRRLEIELLGCYQNLGRCELASASSMLNTGFDMIKWLVETDTEQLKIRLTRLFGHNRSSLFKIHAVLNTPSRDNPTPHEAQSSVLHSAIKTTERKIVATLREISSLDIDVACSCCGLSYEDAYALRNTELDLVEDWVYSNRSAGVLSLRIKTRAEAEKLLKIERVSIASVYLDRVAV